MTSEPIHTLIAGIAKSGTTILFQRVLESLPSGCRAYFEPWTRRELREILARPEPTAAKILLGGEHSGDFAEHRRFDRRILIVRDPRDRLVSQLLYNFYDFKVGGDAEGFARARRILEGKIAAPASVPATEVFDEISALCGRPGVDWLAQHHRIALEFLERVRPCVVRYEDMIEGEVEALGKYLGRPLVMEAELPAAYRRVSRSKTYGEWRAWLVEEDLERIHRLAGDFMDAFGYRREAADLSLPILRENTLDYIEQFRPLPDSP